MIIIIFLLQIVVLHGENNTKACLYRGCQLSAGLLPKDLNLYIKNLLSDPEYEDNILRVISWDIGEEGKRRKRKNLDTERDQFCQMISSTNPTIVGLQDMDGEQSENFKTCLTQYTYAGSKMQTNTRTKYHGLFIKKDRRLQVINTGTFSLNKIPSSSRSTRIPRSCTWAKMRFAERKKSLSYSLSGTKPNRLFWKILRLLKAFTGRQTEYDEKQRPGRSSRSRISYQWFDFYVAVAKLDLYDEDLAKHQLRILIKYLKNQVMDRRRFPVILMADFGWEYNSSVFDKLKNSHWLQNSFVTSFGKYPAVTLLKGRYDEDGSLVDFIFQNRFKSVLTATITKTNDNSQTTFRHRPVLSAVLRKTKHN